MRLFLHMAGIALLSAATANLLMAQHNGAAVHGNAAAGHAGLPAGVRSGAVSPIPPTPIGLQGQFSGLSGSHAAGPQRGGFRGDHFRGERRSHPYVPFTYFFSPGYYPFLDYGDNGDGYPYVPADQGEQTAEVTVNLLGEQIRQLSAQIDELRNAQQSASAGYPPQFPRGYEPSPSSAPPVTLVLHDGNRLQIQNYAVMGQTFWDFSKEPARKIPLASIDIAASAKATEASGAEFPPLEQTR